MKKKTTDHPLLKAGVGAALLGLGTVAGSVIARPRRGTRRVLNAARNKVIVRDFYELAFNQQKPEEAAARSSGPTTSSTTRARPTAGRPSSTS